MFFILLVLLTGCGDAEQSRSGSRRRRRAATPRGLAAGVIGHLPPGSALSASGSGEGVEGLAVMVEVSDDEVETVFIDVRPPSQYSLGECGADSGYEQVTCEMKPHFLEVVRRRADRGSSPDLMGRYYDEDRGSLLIQVWGSDSVRSRQFVRALLNDPFIGLKTSPARNEDGEELANFEELRMEERLEDSPR